MLPVFRYRLTLIRLILPVLLSKMQQLESSIRTGDKAVSQAINQPIFAETLSSSAHTHIPPSEHIHNVSSQTQQETAFQPQQQVCQNTRSTRSQPLVALLSGSMPVALAGPSPQIPGSWIADSSTQVNVPQMRNAPEFIPREPVSMDAPILSSPVPSQPTPLTWAQVAQHNAQAWVSLCPQNL